MQDTGMDMRFIQRVPGQLTPISVCFQYPDGSGGNITVRAAGPLAPTPEDIDRVEPYLEAERGQAIVLAAPEVPLEARGHLLRLGAQHGAFCVASFATAEMQDALRLGLLALVDLLAVNEEEAAALAGQELDPSQPEAFLKACAAVLRPDARLVVTAGSHGAYAHESGTWEYCPAAQVPVVSTAGAGDALLAGVLVGLAAGLPLVMDRPRRTTLAEQSLATALDLGTLLAALSVTSPHTIHPEVNAARLAAFADEMALQLGERLSRLLPGRSTTA
jgi:sugar/nucleoside kinase (ribokinase family)